MEELPSRSAGAPVRHDGRAGSLGFMEAPDESRHDMGVLGVEVVPGPVQVRGHRGYPRQAVLAAHGLDLQNSRDLRDGVGVVRGLQRAGEQGVLTDRLRGVLGVDAAGAEEDQAGHPGGQCRVQQVDLDPKVLAEKLGGVGAVGDDTADLGRGDDDDLGIRPAEEGEDLVAVTQVELGRTLAHEIREALGLELLPHRGADQTVVTRDVRRGGTVQRRRCRRHGHEHNRGALRPRLPGAAPHSPAGRCSRNSRRHSGAFRHPG